MKNIVIIDASPRKGGNTDVMADAVAAAIEAAGASVTRCHIRDAKINPCLGCNACKGDSYACIQKDDMPALVEALSDADGIVFGSPIYFGNITGPGKTFIDRLYCLFNPAKGMLARKAGKKAGVILCSSAPADYTAVSDSLAGAFAVCGATGERKTVLANGLAAGPAKDNADLLAKAADLGKWIGE